jgi:hypothetical protein
MAMTPRGPRSHTDPTPFFAQTGDITVFAGPREDPFFFDLVGFNRAIASAILRNSPGSMRSRDQRHCRRVSGRHGLPGEHPYREDRAGQYWQG